MQEYKINFSHGTIQGGLSKIANPIESIVEGFNNTDEMLEHFANTPNGLFHHFLPLSENKVDFAEYLGFPSDWKNRPNEFFNFWENTGIKSEHLKDYIYDFLDYKELPYGVVQQYTGDYTVFFYTYERQEGLIFFDSTPEIEATKWNMKQYLEKNGFNSNSSEIPKIINGFPYYTKIVILSKNREICYLFNNFDTMNGEIATVGSKYTMETWDYRGISTNDWWKIFSSLVVIVDEEGVKKFYDLDYIYDEDFALYSEKDTVNVLEVEGTECEDIGDFLKQKKIKGGDKMRFSPRLETKTITSYALHDKDDAIKFTNSLIWQDLGDAIISSFLGEKTDAIISFIYFYGVTDVIEAKNYERVKVGRHIFEDVFGYEQKSEYITKTFEFDAPLPKFYNFLDFEPFAEYSIFLPFVGIKQLPLSQVLRSGQGDKKKIKINYNINITTGAALVEVFANNQILSQDSVNLGVHIPFTNQRLDTIYKMIGSAATIGASAINPVLGAATGSMVGLIGGNGGGQTQALNVESGSLGTFEVYQIMKRPQPLNMHILQNIGLKINDFMKISDIKKTGKITAQMINPTANFDFGIFTDDIVQILTTGFYL